MSTSKQAQARRVVAEGIGTMLLLATVVGSGIMAEGLAGTDAAMALLANTLATGAGLVALILAFGGIAAHFNPAVSVFEMLRGSITPRDAGLRVIAQIAGAIAGVVLAHAMFDQPDLLAASPKIRSSVGIAISEGVATFGLIAVITGCERTRREMVPFAVGGYITAAYWFTASTSFANPAVTLARSLTPTFTGIRPADVPVFLVAQAAGTLLAYALARVLWPRQPAV
jgi:glycerol uptake facilitator-like aquaporin